MNPPARTDRTHRTHIRSAPALKGTAPGAPLRIFFDPSFRCNLSCRHCLTQSGPDVDQSYELPPERITSLFLELGLSGVADVVIGGGEPLLSHSLDGLVNGATAGGLGVILETNGTLIDHDCAARLARLPLREIWVSFDGAEQDHDALRGRGAYQKALAGTARIVRTCTGVAARLTIHARSMPRIEQFFADMATAGVPLVKVAAIKPFGRAGLPESRDLLIAKPDPKTAERLLELGIIYGIRVQLSPDDIPLPDMARRAPAPSQGESRTCGAGFSTGYISPAGEVLPCVGMAACSFGSVRDQPFREVWQGREAQEFRKKAVQCGSRRLCEAECFRTPAERHVPAVTGSRVRNLARETGI